MGILEDDCETEDGESSDSDVVDDCETEDWEKDMKKEEEKMAKECEKRKEMLKNLKVNDNVKIKKKTWGKKYIGTITKVYKNNKFYDIKLKNKEFEPLVHVRGHVIIDKYTKVGKKKIPKGVKDLILLKKNKSTKI